MYVCVHEWGVWEYVGGCVLEEGAPSSNVVFMEWDRGRWGGAAAVITGRIGS